MVQCAVPSMLGLAAGGRMRQQIYADSYGIEAWDQSVSSRCFITLVDARSWPQMTGGEAPTRPPTAADYAKAGLPWFDYEAKGVGTLAGAPALTMIKSITEVAEAKGEAPLLDNDPVKPTQVVQVGPG